MNQKILIIDDNSQDRKLLAYFLDKAGMKNVFFAQTGQEGVASVTAHCPQVIVIDTILPDSTGHQICARIRAMPQAIESKIIIVTGSVDAVDASAAKESGADDYCAKTSEFEAVVEAVKKFLCKS